MQTKGKDVTGRKGEADAVSQDSPLTSMLKITLSVFSIRLLRLVELFPSLKKMCMWTSNPYSVVIFEKHMHDLLKSTL